MIAKSSVGGVYHDILEWGSILPRWQQDLLRRVLRARGLSPEDIKELATAAMAETEQQPSPYNALSVADLPTTAVCDDRKILLSMGNLQNVNALRSDQRLTFGPQLTVVYGDNASGKSGYARVLKKVYRARVIDDILGDLLCETPSFDLPRGTFVVKDANCEEETIEWEDGVLANIGSFAVLDNACSVTYMRGGTLAVGPAGIDVPGRFADELDRVKRYLSSQAAQVMPDKKALQALENDTAAGRFVRTLSSATTDEELALNSIWTTKDTNELREIEKGVAEARSQSPSSRRMRLQTRLNALESIGKRLAAWSHAVAQDQLDAIVSAVSGLAEAEKALKVVEAFADPSVPPDLVTGKVWLDLLAAATRYVESVNPKAYATDSMSVNGRCVLCWQRLDDSARNRVRHFHQHLMGTAVKAQRDAVQRIEALLTSVKEVPDSITPEDEALIATEEGLSERVTDLMLTLVSRRDIILSIVRDGTAPDQVPAFDETVLSALRGLYATAKRELTELPANYAEAEQAVGRLERRLLELRTRKSLSESMDEVRQFIAKTREYQRLKSAETGINTRAASTKAAELHTKHMTARYARLVDEELQDLRFRRRRPTLVQTTKKAKVEVTPLVSSDLKHIPPEKVFSEGERTAIALACFLAELRLGDDPSGLIFDDPVSSLDHNVREHVARRLVAVAKERQVIVFTHDLAFLADLREQAKKIQSVECHFQTLIATDYEAGFVENEEPFGARSVRKRLGVLKSLLVDAERAAKDGNVANLRIQGKDFYVRLRSTWERFIEERLFATVVQRLERNVIPGALSKVAYSKELGEKVHEGWRRCSAALEAHDHAPAAGGQSYSIEEMKADLEMLIEVEKTTPHS
jgi:ABC-type dipeptide/oligopeptide/nickel transport system ATPase subunit